MLAARSAPRSTRTLHPEDIPVPKSINFTSRSMSNPSGKRVKTMFSGLISIAKLVFLIPSVNGGKLPSMHDAFCMNESKSLEKLPREGFDLIS